MENFKDKRKRSANFTSSEISVLVSLAKKYRQQIECKITDTNTNKLKEKAWEDIAEKFNSQFNLEIPRPARILKVKYNNLKKQTKEKFAMQKQYVKGTGGGPPQDFHITSVDEDIKKIIGKQLTGFTSHFDDDYEDLDEALGKENLPKVDVDIILTNKESKITDVTPSCRIPPSQPECDLLFIQEDEQQPSCSRVDGILTESDADWSCYTPDMLRQPVSAQLKTTQKNHKNQSSRIRHEPLKTKLGKWATTKQHLAELQQKCFLEEHALKLRHMQEKHEKTIKLQEEETTQRLRLLKEEHEKKIELLQLCKKTLLQ